MDLFWTKVMPNSVNKYPWGGEFSKVKSVKGWEEGLAKRIKKMDDSEFNLFLACVVMTSGQAQYMGVDLSEKIQLFKELRK
jgi:hypothetical protein